MIAKHLAEDVTTGGDLSSRGAVQQLVVAFYRQAAMDDVLGPVFEAAHVDWPSHIATLTEFWAWQLLGERGYVGNPLRAHEPVHALTPLTDVHFERWLELFTSTIDDLFSGPTADLAKGRATKMAGAMRRLLHGRHGDAGASTAPMWATTAGRRAAAPPGGTS